ncbi:CD81 molecule a [Girardinichthys multiradiatus]|uniref:CD81 molecule a n=1 Tax=Girardinichthys multiradiatus TaxID=208333 RepID=UPI001FAD659C|nr:CD81 molecule a [Girardinichthys multiradiatus]
MGVEGCTKCIKHGLFFLNFIFWLAGGVILGVALWLRHDNKTSSLMELKLDGAQAPSSFYTCVHILIAVGAVMMVVGFLGCYGAIQESQCLLGTFFVCLVILFACEVAAGIWGYMHRETVSKEMKNFYDSVYDQAITDSLADPSKKTAVGEVLKVFHETLQCCGKGFGTSVFSVIMSKLGPQDICSTKWLSIDCHGKIDELFSDKIYLVGIAALVVAVIMILEMIFSMVLCCGIRNSPVY